MLLKYYITTVGIFLTGICFSQARLVIDNNAFIVIDNNAKLVVDNPAANAIVTSGTGGNIVTESEFDQVLWRIGTSTGTYVVPFTSQATFTKIPFTATLTGAGTGSGVVYFSTYPGPNYDNNTYRPSDVTHMFDNNTNMINNSIHVIDRFWIIDASGYSAKPSASFGFTYIDAEHLQVGNTIIEPALGAQRFNSNANIWGDYMPQGMTNPAANTTIGVPVAPADFFRSWTLSETTNPLASDLAYFKSSCQENALKLNWQTLSESDVDHFEIEHDENGNYAVIGFIPAGSGSGVQNYEFLSAVKREGIFRLIEVDMDGNRNVKSTLSASCISTETVAVSYNSTINGITMSFDGAAESVETLSIFDAAGRLVFQSELEIANGTNNLVIPDLFLSHGMYMIHLKNGLNQINEKVIAAE